jgi:histidinol dehydrogenase
MRVLPLTEATARRLIEARHSPEMAAERVAARIVADVRRRQDRALLDWSRRFDGGPKTAREIRVPREEIRSARRQANRSLLGAIEFASRSIRIVAERQKPREWTMEVSPGVRVRQRVQPISSVGCYVPGGRFSLVSTLLMTVIPAQVAGVGRIVVACPRPNAALLAAADMLGIREIARMGGAQAIAAFAYGTETVPRVEKIVGPGNKYVTAAKRIVSADCAIDFLAGPTELFIVAEGGDPRFIAADLLAQAEHDPSAVSLLVTTSRPLARAVAAEVERQLSSLPESNPARRSLAKNGSILVARTRKRAVSFANEFGPEHLSLPDGDSRALRQIEAAGSVFLGSWAAQPLGDYATGSNHVLPTNRWARVRGGLSTKDFMRCCTAQQVSRAGLRRLAPIAKALAQAEGLLAHRRAIEVRE